MKTFYAFLANNLVAGIVNFTVWFAIIFYVYLQTHSVLATSLISGLWVATVALTGFWLGSFVDHYSKRWIMVISSLISAVAYALGLIIYLSIDQSSFTSIQSPVLWLFIVILMSGVIAGNIRNIALPALVTILVPEKNRDKANGLVGTVSGIGFLVTSVISGLLVGHSGMLWVLILASVMSVLTAVHLLVTPISEPKTASHVDQPKHIDIKGTLAAIGKVPGLMALILFTMINNFLGGVFMSLMDAYGLSLVSVQVWGLLWGVLSTAFIFGGLLIAKFGLGAKPLRTLFLANILIWSISSVFTVYPSIVPLVIGMFVYLCVVPFIEASEHTIIQKVVPVERQGRVFGFAQSVEQAASPLTAFAIGPLTQFVFIPFMTSGWGAEHMGSWFGTGADRGIALVFTSAGILGLCLSILAMRSRYYPLLSKAYTDS